jgi:hypothetical protein
MRQFAILIFCSFILVNCAKVETVSNTNINDNSDKIVSVSPTVEADKLLKPVTPKINLNSKQKKYLNESLPPQVREILEKAEKFELLAEVRERFDPKDDVMTFEPNRLIKPISENNKKETLEAFYNDAANEDAPAICFEPRHKIRATHLGKTVEIEICFSCSRFVVASPFGEFKGTIVRKNRKFEDFFSRVIKNQSVEIKQ